MDKKRTVLVVDDDLHTRDALVAVIDRAGIRCIAAANAIEALVVLRTEQVQVIVSDYDMPAMDGVELLKLVATRYPQVSRILLTGRSDAQVPARAINLGQAYRFLTKPFRAGELMTALHFAFENSDGELENQRLRSDLRASHALIDAIRRQQPGLVEEIEKRNPSTSVSSWTSAAPY